MFLGSYRPSFDQTTRRIALPIKIRDYLATREIILSSGYEKCIFGFDPNTWKKESEKQLVSPITERRARNIRRFLFSSAKSVRFDSQGRFIVPIDLLEYAQIERPVIIGAGDHFEIWDEQEWNNVQKGLRV